MLLRVAVAPLKGPPARVYISARLRLRLRLWLGLMALLLREARMGKLRC